MNVSQQNSISIYVRDLKLAACLVTLNIPTRMPNPIERVVKDNEEINYIYFEDVGLAKDYIKAWNSPGDYFDGAPKDHPLNNSDHPFWYMRACVRNRDRILDSIKKASTIHIVQKNGKTFLVTTHPKL